MPDPKLALALAALALPAVPALAAIDSGWAEVAYAKSDDCELSVTGNGRTYRIEATGLGAGAAARYRLSNGDMRPLDWSVRADADGRFERYYVPYRWHRRGGTVQVAVSSAHCNVSAAFDWTRFTG